MIINMEKKKRYNQRNTETAERQKKSVGQRGNIGENRKKEDETKKGKKSEQLLTKGEKDIEPKGRQKDRRGRNKETEDD